MHPWPAPATLVPGDKPLWGIRAAFHTYTENRWSQSHWHWTCWDAACVWPHSSGAETGWCAPWVQTNSPRPQSHSGWRRCTWWWSAPVRKGYLVSAGLSIRQPAKESPRTSWRWITQHYSLSPSYFSLINTVSIWDLLCFGCSWKHCLGFASKHHLCGDAPGCLPRLCMDFLVLLAVFLLVPRYLCRTTEVGIWNSRTEMFSDGVARLLMVPVNGLGCFEVNYIMNDSGPFLGVHSPGLLRVLPVKHWFPYSTWRTLWIFFFGPFSFTLCVSIPLESWGAWFLLFNSCVSWASSYQSWQESSTLSLFSFPRKHNL